MESMNVLVFPAGSEIGLEINNALKYAKDINLIGAASVQDHSQAVYSKLVNDLPGIDEESFIPAFNACIEANGIDFVYPALDSVQFFLSEHESEIQAPLVSSPYQTVHICRSKLRTYEHFKGEWFIPKVFDASGAVTSFPVFVKPSVGQGSYDTHIVNNEEELEAVTSNGTEYAICEYLPGEEYTVDCFSDRNELVFMNVRVRERTKAGISVRSQSAPIEEDVRRMAECINAGLDLRGAWFFQVKRDVQGTCKLMEVAPRIAGTMALSRVQGLNFPLLSIYSMLGREFQILDNGIPCILEKAFINRYLIDYDFSTVYIDYDDTLTIRGKTNAQAMALLYQFTNDGKEIVLLTRHDGDILEDLERRKISKDLFSQVIHLDKQTSKADYVKHDQAIFIDDSFSERKAVQERCHIPVFDVDGMEMLVDWRIS